MKQDCYCDLCEKFFSVDYEKGADVMTVANTIIAHHKKLSPDCSANRDEIRCFATGSRQDSFTLPSFIRLASDIAHFRNTQAKAKLK